jgi:hypothetical protein
MLYDRTTPPQGIVMSVRKSQLRGRFAVRLALAGGAMLIAAMAAIDTAEAGARGRAPWCGNLSGHGLDDCNYFTFDQCWTSVRGVGGMCARNPAVVYAPEPRRPRKYRRAARY